jgi:hypothetical protein
MTVERRTRSPGSSACKLFALAVHAGPAPLTKLNAQAIARSVPPDFDGVPRAPSATESGCFPDLITGLLTPRLVMPL